MNVFAPVIYLQHVPHFVPVRSFSRATSTCQCSHLTFSEMPHSSVFCCHFIIVTPAYMVVVVFDGIVDCKVITCRERLWGSGLVLLVELVVVLV